MTLVEFFDKADINNIAGVLAFKPEKVILAGSCNDEMMKSIEDYRSVLKSRDIKTVIEHKKIDSQNLSEVYSILVTIALENEDCVFDLAGGNDMFLVAVGMVAERFKDKVQLHSIDAGKNTVIDCDKATGVCEEIPVNLTVDEIISLYGGKVVYTDEKADSTVKWDFDSEFINDLRKMWDIFKSDVLDWNVHTNEFDCLKIGDKTDADFYVEINKNEAKTALRKKIGFYKLTNEFYKKLSRAGLILNYNPGWDTGVYSFKFKNEQIKRCLTKAGQLLEIYVTFIARGLVMDSGKFFTDFATGVYIDWDGRIQPNDKGNVHNEIDVILMKGLVPVFISCKSGDIEIDELYKLSSVAERFGGPYAKKVLLCARLDKDKNRDVIRARAQEMGIVVIEGVTRMGIAEFRKNLCMIWDN